MKIKTFQKHIKIIKNPDITKVKVINSLIVYMDTRREFSLHTCLKLKFPEVLLQPLKNFLNMASKLEQKPPHSLYLTSTFFFNVKLIFWLVISYCIVVVALNS